MRVSYDEMVGCGAAFMITSMIITAAYEYGRRSQHPLIILSILAIVIIALLVVILRGKRR